jgi:diguanylate cyclase (GGDEF)-like protein
MKNALKKDSDRLTVALYCAIALIPLTLVFVTVERFTARGMFFMTVLAALALVGLWAFRSELLTTKRALTSSHTALRDSVRRARRLHNNDVLTGLPNRTRFRNHLSQKLSSTQTEERHLAVGILTLHNLETIQDVIDDDAGDELICRFTDILNDEISLYMGYVGPGLFAFLLEDISSRKTAFTLMQEIIKSISKDLTVAGLDIRIQVSGGLAIYPGDADSATGLIQKAKLATTNARKTGAQILLFNNSMAPDLLKMQLISDLKTTLAEQRLTWALQPQFDTASQRMIGSELLVRWHHPEYGWVPPNEFVVWAEQTGIISQITEAAVAQACLILQHMKNHAGSLQLSLNLSANDLADTHMVDHIIAQVGDCATLLTLEITETALMKDMDAVMRNMERLRTAGIKLSLDDYGTGYSSLEYLQAFSFDQIKIDKMFIKDLTLIDRNLKLTQASIELGHSLGAIVVAEGVEDKESADLLIAMGCDVLQGYYIGRPRVVSDFQAYLDDHQKVRLQA